MPFTRLRPRISIKSDVWVYFDLQYSGSHGTKSVYHCAMCSGGPGRHTQQRYVFCSWICMSSLCNCWNCYATGLALFYKAVYKQFDQGQSLSLPILSSLIWLSNAWNTCSMCSIPPNTDEQPRCLLSGPLEKYKYFPRELLSHSFANDSILL